MPGPEDKVSYPPRPNIPQEELNKTAPKTRKDHYEGIKTPPIPPLEKSQILKSIESGFKEPEDSGRYVMSPPRDLPYRILPLLTKFISCNTRHLKEVGAFRTLLPEIFGEAGYKLMDDIYASFAYSEFQAARARGQLKNAPNCTAREIAAYICTAYDIQNFPITVVEVNDEKVRVQLYKGLPIYCPYDTRRGDFRLCAATAAYERELTKLCNPRLRGYQSRTKAIGDDCCELTIEPDPDYKG